MNALGCRGRVSLKVIDRLMRRTDVPAQQTPVTSRTRVEIATIPRKHRLIEANITLLTHLSAQAIAYLSNAARVTQQTQQDRVRFRREDTERAIVRSHGIDAWICLREGQC